MIAVRRKAVALGVALLLLTAAWGSEVPNVEIGGTAGPGEMREATRKSIARAYGRAWMVLEQALEEGRPELLDASFIGTARDQFAANIAQQRKSGIRQHYKVRGHKVDILFYSPEGISVQLRDRVQLELQVFDGDSAIHREQVTLNYIALLTPTEVTWKVRALQATSE